MTVPKQVVTKGKSIKTESGTAEIKEILIPKKEVTKPREDGFAGEDNVQPKSVEEDEIVKIDKTKPEPKIEKKVSAKKVSKQQVVSTPQREPQRTLDRKKKPTKRRVKKSTTPKSPPKSTNKKTRTPNKKRSSRPKKRGLMSKILGTDKK